MSYTLNKIFLSLFILIISNNNATYSHKSLITKTLSIAGFFGTFCSCRLLSNRYKGYSTWEYLKYEDKSEVAAILAASAITSLSGYALGHIIWSYSPEGYLEYAKNILKNNLYSNNVLLDKIKSYTNSTAFRQYVYQARDRVAIPIVYEFYSYNSDISRLRKAEQALIHIQKSKSLLISKKMQKECSDLLENISEKIELLGKAMDMLKEDPNWLNMLNAYNIEETKQIQTNIYRELRTLQYQPNIAILLNK